MKKKMTLVSSILLLLTLVFASGACAAEKDINGVIPSENLTVTVSDSENNPVEGVTFKCTTENAEGKIDYTEINPTDQNGITQILGNKKQTAYNLTMDILPEGYTGDCELLKFALNADGLFETGTVNIKLEKKRVEAIENTVVTSPTTAVEGSPSETIITKELVASEPADFTCDTGEKTEENTVAEEMPTPHLSVVVEDKITKVSNSIGTMALSFLKIAGTMH